MEVLLIEDSVSDAQLVETLIGSSNLDQPTLHHARRFAQAQEMLSAHSYDLALLDLHLPDGEGPGLIRELKQQSPEMPVVVLTGVGDEAIAAAALEEGAQDCVVKSETFSPKNLSQSSTTDIGNLLVRRIQHAVKRAKLIQENNQTCDQLAHQNNNHSNNDGLWDWDLQRNQVYLSPRWKSALGLYRSAINSSPSEWLTRIHPQDKARFEKTLQDYLTRRLSQFYCEYRIQHTQGHYIWVLVQGKALWDEADVAYRIVGSQTDITVRKAAEEEAYENRELAQTALHTVGAGLLTLQAKFYMDEGLYEKAEPLLQSALAIHKSLLGIAHPDVATSLYNLASLYDNQFRFLEAESLFKEALAIFEDTLGLRHPHTQQVSRKVDMICRLNQVMQVSAQCGSIEELWAGD